MKTASTIIGIIAAIGTTSCWLPQVLKTVRTRSARDFSWLYLTMLIIGVTCWVVYGFLEKDWIVVTANAATLALVLVVTAVKMRCG
jgi:MtN3 and saliva related transmembrane protein